MTQLEQAKKRLVKLLAAASRINAEIADQLELVNALYDAERTIEAGIAAGYLKQDPDTTVHWIS